MAYNVTYQAPNSYLSQIEQMRRLQNVVQPQKAPETDYAKLIKDAIEAGDISNLGALAKQREAKIASNLTQYTDVKPTSDLLGEYSYLMNGTNPSVEDYLPATKKANETFQKSQGTYVEQPYVEPIKYGKPTPLQAPQQYQAPQSYAPQQYQAPQQQAFTYTRPNFSKQIEEIFSNELASYLSSSKAAYDKSRSDINAQTPGIQQNARQARTMNDTDYYTQGLPELYKAMEAGGQYKGGENITGQIALNATRGQNRGQIDTSEMNQLGALQKVISDLNAEQPLQEQAATQGFQSKKAQSLMDAEKYGMDYEAKLAELMGTFQGQKTLQSQQYDTQNAQRMADLTGVINGQQTLAARQNTTQNNQWQQGFDQNAAQNTVQNQQWETTNRQGQAQQAWSNQFQEGQETTQKSQYDATAAYNATRAQVLDDQWLQQFDANQQQLIVDNLYKKGQLKQDEYNGLTSRISANKSGNAAPKADSFNLDDWGRTLDAEFLPRQDSNGNIISNTGITDPATRRQRILSLGLSDSSTDQLLMKYGLPINK